MPRFWPPCLPINCPESAGHDACHQPRHRPWPTGCACKRYRMRRLATIVASSPLLYKAMQFIGAAYLIYVGVRFLAASSKIFLRAAPGRATSPSLLAPFRQGDLQSAESDVAFLYARDTSAAFRRIAGPAILHPRSDDESHRAAGPWCGGPHLRHIQQLVVAQQCLCGVAAAHCGQHHDRAWHTVAAFSSRARPSPMIRTGWSTSG